MALHDIKERIRKKKRRRKRRIMFLLIVLLAFSIGVTLLKATSFDIKQVIFTGQEAIPLAYLERQTEGVKGENIFLLRKKEVLSMLDSNAYFKSMTLKRKFPNTIEIELVEKKAEISYPYQGITSLLNKEGVLLQTGTNAIEGGLLLIDDVDLPKLGENLYEEDLTKQNFLKEFRSLQLRNGSEITFYQVDLRDMSKIKTYYRDIEVLIGYPEDLKGKLNAAINIISGGQLYEMVGYVDVSYLDYPVFYDENAPLEDVETPVEGNSVEEIPEEDTQVAEEQNPNDLEESIEETP